MPNTLSSHSLLDTLSWHSLLDTLAWRFGWALLLDTLSSYACKDTLARHSCLTRLQDTLDRTPLLDTLAGHSCWTLLLDTPAGHSFLTFFARHSCWALLLHTLAGHSYRTVLLDTLAGHSSWTLLLDADTLARHACWTLFLGTLAGHSFLTLLLDTRAGHSWHTWQDTPARHSCFHTAASFHKTSIFHETFTKSDNPTFQNEHFPRDFHQKWQSKLPSKLPKPAFPTRLSPKVTIQISKTNIFHEIFTKSDNPSFQNERFTRDFSQKRTSEHTLCIANPNVTTRFNTSKTPLWNCKSQYNCDANVSLSWNPAPVQRNHLFQSSSLQCTAPATKHDFRHFPQDIQNCNFS